jgi:hypothetical protein
MRWVEEPNKHNPKSPYEALVTEASEPLTLAFVEYWKRLLTDGIPLAPADRYSLAMEIVARKFQDDPSPGNLRVSFYNSLKRQSEGVPVYRLHGNYFECVQEEKEDDTSFEARHLVWLLDQYRTLKEAARDSSLVQLFEKINSPCPMEIRAGTSNGWFALQIDQTEFGPLPENDRLLLAGKETVPDDPLQNLAGGVLDVAWMRLMQEFNTALIQYTPPHFKSIHCKLTEGIEQGQRALFYDIQCPQFPDEGTTNPNARLHTAATQVVQHLTAERAKFPGIIVRLDMQSNGTWLHSVEFLNKSNP